MKHISSFLLALLLAACVRQYAPNPDPNHIHADFALYIDGEKMNFAREEYMSGSAQEGRDEAEHKHPYLHLHDGIGHVIHAHKPGLTLREFFDSLTVELPLDRLRMFINGVEVIPDLGYIFSDMDQILLTTDRDDGTVQYQLKLLTADACLYSRTCPWRGDPPAENCIADPEVPCVEP